MGLSLLVALLAAPAAMAAGAAIAPRAINDFDIVQFALNLVRT